MELIKIEQENGKETVNARDLHKFLEVKTRFNDWFRNRVMSYDFTDYTAVTENLVSGGNVIEYHISIDMAKELSMVERNEKGKQARRYFIEMENKAKNQISNLSPAEAFLQQAQMMVEQEKRLSLMDNRMDLIEARQKTHVDDYFTIVGFCSLNRLQVTLKDSADLGRKCAKLSREKGYTIDSVLDARYGKVNAYHIDILQEIV